MYFLVEVRLLNWSGKKSIKIVVDACKLTADNLRDISDEEIIKTIVKNDYSSALEHIWFSFYIKCSIACQREILEHRIASHTTRSTRYCEESMSKIYFPIDMDEKDRDKVDKYIDEMHKMYRYLKERYGREVARYVLPLGTYTEFVWTINARSLINFLGLRLCVRAAPEIREIAIKIHKIVKKLVPEIFKYVGCRGINLGTCPENKIRPKNCPYIGKIKSKFEVAWYES